MSYLKTVSLLNGSFREQNKLTKITLDLDHVRQWLEYIGYIRTLVWIVVLIRRMKRYIPRTKTEFIMILTTLSMFGFKKQLASCPRRGLMFHLLYSINRFITRFLLIVADRYSRIWILWNVHVASSRHAKYEPLYFFVYTNTIGYSLFKTFAIKRGTATL